ncbi:IS66 family transposase [Cohnella sp.]|uniref:IS66 family transposase n=1 Tax=Cohnella sp. TaxID=1883426 RepID=UPI00356B41C1
MELTPQQVLDICKGDEEIAEKFNALLALNLKLTETVAAQALRIEALEKRIHELERQLGQNSNNSSKPPSSDGLRKPPVNLRKSGGKRGAPKGHPGHTLHQAEHPDHIITLPTEQTCGHCHSSLRDAKFIGHEKRQVLDLPVPQLVVTEYRAEQRRCSCCHRITQASFPADVTAPVQYGKGFSAWTVYLNARHMIPLERIRELFADLTNQYLSEGTLLSFMRRTHAKLSTVESFIRERIAESPVLHADETGCRVEGKTRWLHTHSTAEWTLLNVHEKRGFKAFSEVGILLRHLGTVVHDCHSSYFKEKYRFIHALCGVHLIRECIGIIQNDHQRWAAHMIRLLLTSWNMAKVARAQGRPLEPDTIHRIEHLYDTILQRGESVWHQGKVRPKTGTRGRKCKSPAANLGERFRMHKESILRFLYDARVPFDNNQAERDLRMTKVKQKVSGSFRTWEGAHQFARAHGFISTLRKQGLPVLPSLFAILQGNFAFPQGT